MKDQFGEYKTLTGYEGSGKCWWCGGEYPKGRYRRYCSEKCSDQYWEHFSWHSAVPAALIRADHKCQECSSPHQLDVHHIDPLGDEPRHFSIKNKPENLVVLCRSCHRKRHTKPKKGSIEETKADGQLMMDFTGGKSSD